MQAKHSHAQAQESVALGKHVSELRNDVGTQATRLADTVHDLKRQIPEARREAQESVARELVALCEAVERTTTACMNLRLPSLLFGARRASLEEQMRTPQELLRRRVADALQRLKIEAVASIGVAFESACMRAIASTSSGATPGTVTEICRQGYRLDGNLLQTAEVRVEK